MSLWSELKRRKVWRVAAAYLIVGLGVLGAAEVILDPLGLGAARPFIVIGTLLGFPIALVLAWAYEMTPEGVVRDSAAIAPQEADLRAVELRPGFGFAQAWHSVACALLGQTEESLKSARIARESEPDSAYVQTIAWAASGIYCRQPEEAADAMVRLQSVFPDHGFVAQQSAMVLAMSNRWEEALPAADQSLARAPDEPFMLAIYAWMLRGSGRGKEADQISARLDDWSRDRFIPSSLRAMALWGDPDAYHHEARRDAIVALLRQAFQNNDPLIKVLVQMPGLDPYRTDPRVDALIRSVGLPAWTAEAMTERFGITFDPPPDP